MKKISLVIFIVSVFIILWMGNNLFAQPPQDEKNEVKDKVGANQMRISDLEPAKKHEFVSEDEIKGKKIEIGFDKV